jgi:hypothetical protein
VKSSKGAHTYQIREHLMRGGTLTQIDAIAKFGCFRLAARIYDIRKTGLEIHRIMVKTDQRRVFAKYYLSASISPTGVYGYHKGVIE